MGGYQNFMLRMRMSGNNLRNEQIMDSKYILSDTFADDPSYIPEGVTIWNTDRVIHPRIYSETYRATSPAHAKIQTLIHEPFYMGEIIPWTNHGYWICLDSNNLHDIQWEGTLAYCNYMLKFRSLITGDILTYPVHILNATQYGSGETNRYDKSLHMTVGTSQLLIYISYDSETSMIDNGVRFLIDRHATAPTAFKVTQADMVSYSDGGNRGYISLTVYEDQFNPDTDNTDLMIADYWKDPVNEHENTNNSNGYWI